MVTGRFSVIVKLMLRRKKWFSREREANSGVMDSLKSDAPPEVSSQG